MIVSIGLILLGLILLGGGGEILLRGAVALAQRLQLTPAVIGLTVVAAGTSVPELAVSVLSGFQGKAEIAVGNVIGSNIFNVTMILGLAALITPLVVTGNTIKFEYPVMVLVSYLCLVLIDDGTISRLDGSLLILTYLGFTVYVIGLVRDRMREEEKKLFKEEVVELSIPPMGMGKLLFLIAAGIGLLAAGADLTVRGAVEIGRYFGMTERVIGLTIVACGTSLPEVVTSLVAGVRGRDDVAIGNVVGSNLFNILGILGISALISPLPVSLEGRTTDAYWMIGTALLLFPVMKSGMRINRYEGGALLGVFAFYLFIILR